MSPLLRGLAGLLIVTSLGRIGAADEPQKYALRYQFHPGETICWEVEHRTNVKTSVSKMVQNAEMASFSLKQWHVREVRADGTATFEHSVAWVDMRQKLDGRTEVRFDSRTDKKPPVGFEGVAKSIGVPLSVITMNATGKVLHRDRRNGPQSASSPNHDVTNENAMTIPLPEGPVAIGHTWSVPQDIDIPLENGVGVKRIKAVQQFTLEDVKTGVAVIRVSTDMLTPVTDPAIEAQLVQREAVGRVRFDIESGRMIAQQMDIDKRVVGFRGEASVIHYINRFSERLLPEKDRTASAAH
jgi:hypothetical protein